ncbi:hypothetical protein P7C73_g518, partial [Tremellales sp. Uapishka_1]
MGLASKLAAASGGPAAPAAPSQYGAPQSQPQQSYGQPQQQQYGQQQQQQPQSGYAGVGSAVPSVPGGRPQSGQYAPPPGAPPFPSAQPYGQQPQGQSQYGQQQPGQYGQQQPGQYGQQQSGQYGQQQSGQSGQYGQQQQQPGQYGAQPGQIYGQNPPAYPGQQGQQQQGQGYGAPPPSGGGNAQNAGFLLSQLQQCVTDQHLQAFYPQGSLDVIAAQVASSGALAKIAAEWKIPMELATDLVKLALFDVVLYIDDSGSMAFEEGGERIDDLKLILSRVAFCTSLFDQDGIQVRFMNSRIDGNNINSEQAAMSLVQQVKFSGLTPLGTSLYQKILQPLVLGPARSGQLQKPVLVIAITDGVPAGEPKDEICNVILRTDAELKRTRYGPDAISYQFAQVGTDMKAMKFLEELDNDPRIGGLIDCTSNFEAEQAEMARKSGVDLSPSMWLVKLLM